MPDVIVKPYSSCYDDPRLSIKVANLNENQKITIQSCQTSDKGKYFHAYAYYVADGSGKVDVSTDPSLGGYYTGVEPLGLLWALKSPPGPNHSYSSLIKYIVTKPALITLKIFNGHIDIDNLEEKFSSDRQLAFTKFERRFMNSHIDRIVVKEGDVRAVLFVPQTTGRFFGIVDIGGVYGGMFEMRSALLANHGFVVLSLSLFGVFDQPKRLDALDITYIDRAVEYLLKHNKVLKDGVGVIGISFGGSACLAASTFNDKIKCVVNISGPLSASGMTNFKYGNQTWIPTEEKIDGYPIVNGIQQPDGVIQTPIYSEVNKHFPEFQKSRANLLFIFGEADKGLNAKEQSELAKKILESSGKTNYEIKIYPGTSHVIAPPYLPLYATGYNWPNTKHVMYIGGTPKEHAYGQVEAWRYIINFLKKNISQHQSDLHSKL